MTAVIDTGPLLVFAKLQRLRLLDFLYKTLLIPAPVYREAVSVGLERGYRDAVELQTFLVHHHWPTISPVTLPPPLQGALLGEGELQAIAVAHAQGIPLLIDDSDARRTADRLGITTRGSLGILVQAFRQGHLLAPELDDLLSTIENRQDIWIRPELCERVRQSLLRN